MVLLVKKMGRAKIPITWIKSDASRHVTFTKRKKGLKKKVEELAILCGVEVCMICFSPQGSMSIKTTNNSNDPENININTPTSTSSTTTSTTTTTNSSSNGSPYSWGLPGVGHVINKYRSLSKEEQDKKKLDNTSLLEQQIKKLKSEVRLKMEENESKESERAYLLWDDRLNSYGVDELGQLAEIIAERTREVYEKIENLVMMSSGELYGHHHHHHHPPQQALEGGATDFSTHMNGGPGNLLYDDEGMMMMMMMEYPPDSHHHQRGSLEANEPSNPPRFASFLGGNQILHGGGGSSMNEEIDEANLGKYNPILNHAPPQVNPFNSIQAFAANVNPLYNNSVIGNGLVLNHQNPPSYHGNGINHHQYGLLDHNIPLLSLVNHEYTFNNMEDGKSILPMPSSTPPPSNSIYIDGSPMLMQGGECIGGDHGMIHANDNAAANASITSQLTSSPLIKLKEFVYLQPELEQGDVNVDHDDNEVDGGGSGGALGSIRY